MKKLLTWILIITLAVTLCLTSCDKPTTDNGGTKDTTASATETGGATEDGTVTDENGDVVTADPETEPEVETEIVTDVEIVTDENGEAVTDEAGEIVTEIVTDIVTVAPAPDATVSPDTEDGENDDNDPSPDAPVVTPAAKTPYAWYNAAYRTVGSLTNGTLAFKMLAVSGSYSNEMTATVKLSDGNYSVTQSGEEAPMLYVDGICYDVAGKRIAEISSETFCDDYFPYYPLTNGMIPLNEEILDGIAFEEADGEVTFSVTLTKEDFEELSGSSSETMKDMVCTAVFSQNGTFKRAEYAASFEFTDEKTGEYYSSSSVLSVALSDLGSTAPITAPEDAAEYETVNVEENFTPTVNGPSDMENKNPEMTKDENGADADIPEYNDPSNEDKPEDLEIYEREERENIDLNGDGVIGKPPVSEDKSEDEEMEDEKVYELEMKTGNDINGDGVIGRPDKTEVPEENVDENAKNEMENDIVIENGAIADDKELPETVVPANKDDALNP